MTNDNAHDADLIAASGDQLGGGDGASLGHPASGPLGVRLDPQNPHGRDGLGPAQGELMSCLQLSSERGCLASSGPMGARHTSYLCAGIPRMRTH